MKNSLPAILMSAAILMGMPLFAQTPGSPGDAVSPRASAAVGKLLPVKEKDAAWLAQQRKSYPLDVCLTSDEKLGSMGEADQRIYRVAGQADRLVMFCCEGCQDDFLKEPTKFIAKLDSAAKAKGKSDAGSRGGQTQGDSDSSAK